MRTLSFVLALSCIVLQAPVRADDACLTGGSTLSDQRSLASLADATDAACPCAAAASGRSYQRCARDVLRAQLTGGAVRPECEKTVRLDLRGTACGTAKVACGAAPISGDGSPSCGLARPSACRDSRRLDRTACTDEDSCADVITWTAGTCFDPRDQGPFTPGVQTISWTKDSVVMPGTPRTLDTIIWYPAPKGSGPITSAFGAVVGAPLDPSGGPYPVVLFSHGSCGYPAQSLFLTPLLASRGFIVVAPPHPGNTIFEFPTCGTPAAQTAAFLERPADMIFVLDQIIAAGQDPTSLFHGVVDGSRVAMTGHSFGGLDVYLVTERDPRVTIAVPMAPAALTKPHLDVPSLTMIGAIDTQVNNTLTRAAYDASVTPKLLVEIEHAGHFAFSDGCFPSPDCNPPTTLTQPEAHADVLRYVVPFIERYLGGEDKVVPLLGSPTGPGFVYQASF
jgi:predicted dienelactone hydrolase